MLKSCFQDPARVWNTDETAIELGVSKKRVLAQRGVKVLYNVSSSTRDHITCVLTVSAGGDMVPPMVVFRGVRNVATERLALLPKDGRSGAWSLQSTEKGFITSEKFILVLQDLVKVLEKKQVERPVIMFMDGATPHISLAMAGFCKTQGIQPWLFKPNTTHLTQPLDLTVMKSLKDKLKVKVTAWQQSNTTSLTKYTVVPLLREAVEEVLTKPSIISNGFKRAGLLPWDPTAVDVRKLLPSTIFAKPESASKSESTVKQADPTESEKLETSVKFVESETSAASSSKTGTVTDLERNEEQQAEVILVKEDQVNQEVKEKNGLVKEQD